MKDKIEISLSCQPVPVDPGKYQNGKTDIKLIGPVTGMIALLVAGFYATPHLEALTRCALQIKEKGKGETINKDFFLAELAKVKEQNQKAKTQTL